MLWLRRAGALLLGSVLSMSAAFFFAPNFLCVVHTVPVDHPADSIVVLGGAPGYRAPRAAEIYKNGLGKRVLVDGIGDCFGARMLLIQSGVPELAVHIECDSKSTKENAQFGTQILRAQEAKRVILVTSWYHSRRALATYRHFAPEIEFYSMPSYEHMTRVPRHWYEAKYVLTEYIKIVGYAVRWQIFPW